MTNCELDAEVARKVMNWVSVHREGDWGLFGREFGGLRDYPVPHYSTDLNEAFRVVEKMREKKVPIQIGHVYHTWPESWEFLARAYIPDMEIRRDYIPIFETDESPARAICLCALKVIEEMEKK